MWVWFVWQCVCTLYMLCICVVCTAGVVCIDCVLCVCAVYCMSVTHVVYSVCCMSLYRFCVVHAVCAAYVLCCVCASVCVVCPCYVSTHIVYVVCVLCMQGCSWRPGELPRELKELPCCPGPGTPAPHSPGTASEVRDRLGKGTKLPHPLPGWSAVRPAGLAPGVTGLF